MDLDNVTLTQTTPDHGVHLIFCAEVGESCMLIDACLDTSHIYHDESLAPPYSVMALASAIGIGALLRWAAKEGTVVAKVPYTILVFLVGLIYGFLSDINADENFLDKGTSLADIDPHLIFFIFLPILIFESAFSIDGHVFKKVVWHCLLLAGPGLIISSGLTATLAKLILPSEEPYGWSWVTCFLLGAILSATDPVAVVALLKELGCPGEVGTLIEGESLFNDGTAIVIFTVLKSSVPDGELDKTAAEIVGELCRVTILGPIIGLAMGVILEMVLTRVFNDPLIEVTLSVAAAYMTFFLAEGALHVSGVLGLVTLGLYLSIHRQCFSPEVEHMLHSFWGILVFMANTVIFSLAGLIVSKKAFSDIKAIDYLYLFMLYVVINVVRVVVLGLMSPIMKRFKFKLDMKSYTLVAWGGLRGAVGLALVLIVENDQDIMCSHPHLGPHFIFLGSGIVILTLVVNGGSTGHLVKWLGLSDVPDSRKRAMNDAYELAIEVQERAIHELSSESVMALANWSRVRQLTVESTEHPFGGDDGGEGELIDAFTQGRNVYFKTFIAELWHLNHQGTLTAQSMRWLLEKAQVIRDASRKKVLSEKFKKSSSLLETPMLESLFEPSLLDKAQTVIVPCGGLRATRADDLEAKRWLRAFEITTAYIQAHEAVCEKIVSFNLGQETVNRIRDHCKQERSEGLTLLGSYEELRPTVAVAIKTKQAARVVLNRSRAAVEDVIAGGKLDPEDGKTLIDNIEAQMEVLRRLATTEMELPEPVEVLQQVRWASIDEGGLRKLLSRSTTLAIPKGKGICRPGTTVILLTGVGKESRMGSQIYLGPGHTVGLYHALDDCSTEMRHNTTVADTDAVVLSIKHSELMGIAGQYPSMLSAMWHTAGTDAGSRLLSQIPQYKTCDKADLRRVCMSGEVLLHPTPTRVKIRRGILYIVLHGEAKAVLNDVEGLPAISKALSVLPSGFKEVMMSKGGVLFAIPDAKSDHLRAQKRWKAVASKISMIHTCVTVLTERASCRHMRRDIITTLIQGFFGRGRSLDVLTGGFSGNHASLVGSSIFSPIYRGVSSQFPGSMTSIGSSDEVAKMKPTLLKQRQARKDYNGYFFDGPEPLVEPLLGREEHVVVGSNNNPSFRRGFESESVDLVAARNLELAAAALRSRSIESIKTHEVVKELAVTKSELERERALRMSLSPQRDTANPLLPSTRQSGTTASSGGSSEAASNSTPSSKKTFIERLFERPAEELIPHEEL